MISRVRYVLLLGSVIGLLGGCATNLTDSWDDRAESSRAFKDALSKCRWQHNGGFRSNRYLPPTHPGIDECLKTAGWNSDGSRIAGEGGQEAENSR